MISHLQGKSVILCKIRYQLCDVFIMEKFGAQSKWRVRLTWKTRSQHEAWQCFVYSLNTPDQRNVDKLLWTSLPPWVSLKTLTAVITRETQFNRSHQRACEGLPLDQTSTPVWAPVVAKRHSGKCREVEVCWSLVIWNTLKVDWSILPSHMYTLYSKYNYNNTIL